MAISPYRYESHVYGDERLNQTRKAILLFIAHESVGTKDPAGWVELSHKCIGAAIGARQQTVSRNMAWLVEHRYLVHLQPMAPGRYLTGKYRLPAAYPMTAKEPTVHVREEPLVHVREEPQIVALDAQQVRSYLHEATPPTRPPAAAEVATDISPEPETAAPAPALEGAEPDPANPVATDLQVWQQLDDERRNQQLAELANPPVIPKHRDPLAIACPERGCVAAPGEPCPGYRLKGIPHLARRLAVYGDLAVSA